MASRIFEQSGVTLHWEICDGPGARDGACQGPLDSSVIFLRLLPKAMTAKVAKGEPQFGFAPLPADGSPGVHAYIYLDRVEELASRHLIFRPQLLGQIMAHEIGHLLLGSNSHTSHGVMRARWGGDNLKEANIRLAYFNRQQTGRIHANLADRLARITP